MQLTPLKTALFSATFLPAAVLATDLTPVLVTANQQTQSLAHITVDSVIIDSATLQAKHYTTLLDALREVPGISFTRNGPTGTSTSLFLRGSNNNRTLVLLDGVRLNDPASTNGANFTSISLNNIERIEIIKGAQSGVWGADAAAGVINLISKKTPGQKLQLESGAYQTRKGAYNGQFLFGQEQQHSLRLGAERLLSDGFTAQVPEGGDIDTYEADGIAQTHLNAQLDFALDNNQRLILSHNHTDTYGEYDGFKAPDSQKRYQNRTGLSTLIWRNPQHEVRLEQSRFISEQLDEGNPDHVTGLTQALNLKQQLGQWVLGANYTRNQADSNKYSWSQGQNQQLSGRSHSHALFSTYAHQLGAWQFNEALRWDHFDSFGSQFTGKFGASYAFNTQHRLSANFGTAFNAPSLIQIINPFGAPNSDLEPEKTREASLSYQWRSLSLTYFDKNVRNLIDGEFGADGYRFLNIDGTTQIKGVELGWQHRVNSLDLQLNYTHLQSKTANGEPLARRPKDQVNLAINWFIDPQWDLNLHALYIGERRPSAFDGLAKSTQYYAVVNSVLNYQANQQTQLYLKLDNLFNQRYQVVDGFATAERSAYLGVNHAF
ncbi:MAG: TonB-dependent receptor [Thiotrichales bacterium]|nr:TonB-dependent receptor [Thiotrichales bacterium]